MSVQASPISLSAFVSPAASTVKGSPADSTSSKLSDLTLSISSRGSSIIDSLAPPNSIGLHPIHLPGQLYQMEDDPLDDLSGRVDSTRERSLSSESGQPGRFNFTDGPSPHLSMFLSTPAPTNDDDVFYEN